MIPIGVLKNVQHDPVTLTPSVLREAMRTSGATTVTTTLTPDEAALLSRVNQADVEWPVLREDELEDYSLAHSKLLLPPECEERRKRQEYCYRWVKGTAERVDEMRSLPGPFKWAIVNRSNAPYLPDHYFDSATGAVRRLDQVLLYKPYRAYLDEKRINDGANKARENGANPLMRNGQVRNVGDTPDGVKYSGGVGEQLGINTVQRVLKESALPEFSDRPGSAESVEGQL